MNENSKMKKLELFAQRLKELRLARNWTQEVVAEQLETSRSLLSYYESAEREPGFTTILNLSKIFDVDPSYLMGESAVKKLNNKK